MGRANEGKPIDMVEDMSVRRVGRCVLETGSQPWVFAITNAAAIDVHWQASLAANPAMFNGVIHLVHEFSIGHDAETGGETFWASLLRTEFKSYLYWRAQGFPETGVRDGFGSALIRSAESHVVLGRQRQGNINAGLCYLPGGFIDPSDVTSSGLVDIDASIARELEEETGLGPVDMTLQPGYLLTLAGPLISIAREYRSPLSAQALRARILVQIGNDPASELVDAVIVRSPADFADLAMPVYAKVLLPWLFDGGR